MYGVGDNHFNYTHAVDKGKRKGKEIKVIHCG
jgi:hypothetical protein